MLYLPQNIPAVGLLLEEGYCVEEYGVKRWNEVRGPMRVLLLNLMPQKTVTELDISRMLSSEEHDVQLIPMKIAGQTYKTTPMEHMVAFYLDFEEFKADTFDGLIITGAPVEHLPFEEVRYWRELCEIMDWARTHVASTLYICWAAQAGLYYHYGIPKYSLPAKKFGVFSQNVLCCGLGLFRNMEPNFPMPNSRHTEVKAKDFQTQMGVKIVASSEESGVGVALSEGGREVYIVGHLEYEPYTLHHEYWRDKKKGLPIDLPLHYYQDESCSIIDFSWEKSAKQFYTNWLQLCEQVKMQMKSN